MSREAKERTDFNRKSLLSNSWFYLKLWAKVFPLGLCSIPLFAVASVLIIYETINIPRVIVEVLEHGGGIETLLSGLWIPIVVVVAFKAFREVLLTVLMAKASKPMMHLYTIMMNNKILSLHYQTLTSPGVQSKLSRAKQVTLGGDGQGIHFFGLTLAELLSAVLGAVVFASGVVYLDTLLLVIILGSALVNLLFGFYVGRYADQSMQNRSEDEKKFHYVLRSLEDRTFAKDIRLHDMSRWLLRKFETYHENYSGYLRKEQWVRSLAVLLSATLIFLRDIVAYIYLIYLLSTGRISVSEFVFTLGLVIQFSLWMMAIVDKINSLITFSTLMNPIREFLEVPESIRDFGGGDAGNSGRVSGGITAFGDAKASDVCAKPSIEFRNMSFRYPGSETWIFRDFSLRIPGGQRLAIVGINGAGKTTLMLLLMGLLHPTEGDILIDGKSYNEFTPSERYKLFSPLFQDIHIFPESVLTNITGGQHYSEESHSDSEKMNETRLYKALKRSGMDAIIAELPDGGETYLVKNSQDKAIDLSGGQNQRLLFARALYKDAKISILDEPTAALDPIAESRIYEEYDGVSKDKTSIFISHRLASTRFCDRVILIEHGKIIESGTHGELMALGGEYRKMYEVQSRYYQESAKEMNEGGEYVEANS